MANDAAAVSLSAHDDDFDPHRGEDPVELRQNLWTLLVVRVTVVTFLLAATVFFGLTQSEAIPILSSTEGLLYAMVALVYLASVFYALVLRLSTQFEALKRLAYVQLIGDALFAGGLVMVTGGTSSVFTFFFSLSIMLAAIILYRRGALFIASVSALLLMLIGLVEVGLIGEGVWLARLRQETLAEGIPSTELTNSVIYNISVNMVAFYAIAFLASYLVDKLRRSDIKLEQNRASLEDLKALHQNIVSSIQSGLITVNQSHQITFFNRFAEQITGYDADDVLYQDITRFFGDLKQIFMNEDKLHSQHEELTAQILGGRVAFIRWTISPLVDARNEPIGHVLIFEDVTRVREMEERMKRADQFASLGKLASAIAHEIRNPLASISGSIQLLSGHAGLEDEDRKLMDIVSRETDALNQWITDFLTYARPRQGDRVRLDLQRMIEEAVLVLKHDQKSEMIDVTVESTGECFVIADPIYLKQVVWNILNNAVQAMSDGGALTVSVEPVTDDRGDFYRARFCDTGPGIPGHILDRVFEPFFTTKEEGTGLGLATVYRVVTEHGGTVTVDTERGQGTIFNVDLPRYQVI